MIETMSESSTGTSSQRFLDARNSYSSARNEQRLLIIDVLKSAGFDVKTRGNAGRGLSKYTSGGRLTPPFDLSGWMWVEGEREGVFVVVSLQVLDQDPNSMNVHALIDRIGVDVFRPDTPVDESDALFERATTGLQLPLDDNGRAALLALIEQKVQTLA